MEGVYSIPTNAKTPLIGNIWFLYTGFMALHLKVNYGLRTQQTEGFVPMGAPPTFMGSAPPAYAPPPAYNTASYY